MRLLIDMNLSPAWRGFLESKGFEARHWFEIGCPDAPDAEIMAWARDNGHVVLTHDLDFGIIPALTQTHGPSVIQIRARVRAMRFPRISVRRSVLHCESGLVRSRMVLWLLWMKRIRGCAFFRSQNSPEKITAGKTDPPASMGFGP